MTIFLILSQLSWQLTVSMLVHSMNWWSKWQFCSYYGLVNILHKPTSKVSPNSQLCIATCSPVIVIVIACECTYICTSSRTISSPCCLLLAAMINAVHKLIAYVANRCCWLLKIYSFSRSPPLFLHFHDCVHVCWGQEICFHNCAELYFSTLMNIFCHLPYLFSSAKHSLSLKCWHSVRVLQKQPWPV